MTIFLVEITQGSYEEYIINTTKVFSSKKQLYKWLWDYYTEEESLKQMGMEHGIIKEVELNTNKVISISDGFYFPTTKDVDYSEETLKLIHQHVEGNLINPRHLDWKTKTAYDLMYPEPNDLEALKKLKDSL
jgi:hypothetical protein